MVLEYLDNYSSEVKDQIDSSRTKQTLLKSYVFETYNEEIWNEKYSEQPKLSISKLLATREYTPLQIDEQFYRLTRGNQTVGFVEEINNRFSIMYSIDKASNSDKYANNLVKQSTILDSLWLSGIMFDGFLEKMLQEQHPRRYIKMKFEFDPFISRLHLNKVSAQAIDIGFENEEEDLIIDDNRISSTTLFEKVAEIGQKISGVRELLPFFHSVGLMRFPSRAGRGGHDFYQNGKVTNRSENFLDHRYQIIDTVNKYQKITEDIEASTWVNFEKISSADKVNSLAFKGSPITIKFDHPLKDQVFINFINYVFDKGREPFRIMGKPIWVSSSRVHVYGVDLHLWQKIMLDLSPDQFTVFIPRGTCGNTVHRLVTNIQRFLDPRINVYIGNIKYQDVIEKVIEGDDEFDNK